jgi:hypothetical protein
MDKYKKLYSMGQGLLQFSRGETQGNRGEFALSVNCRRIRKLPVFLNKVTLILPDGGREQIYRDCKAKAAATFGKAGRGGFTSFLFSGARIAAGFGDVFARFMRRFIQMTGFAGRHAAVARGFFMHRTNPLLAAIQSLRFLIGYLSRFNALIDTRALLFLTVAFRFAGGAKAHLDQQHS